MAGTEALVRAFFSMCEAEMRAEPWLLCMISHLTVARAASTARRASRPNSTRRPKIIRGADHTLGYEGASPPIFGLLAPRF